MGRCVEGNCPINWAPFRSGSSVGCYRHFSKTKLSWTDAREHCNLQNAELASIHSQEEHEFILQLSKEHVSTWLGGSDSKTKGLYLWTDQSPWTYTNWRTDEPLNPDGTHNCIEMTTHKTLRFKGTWSVYRCNQSTTFICKLKRTDRA